MLPDCSLLPFGALRTAGNSPCALPPLPPFQLQAPPEAPARGAGAGATARAPPRPQARAAAPRARGSRRGERGGGGRRGVGAAARAPPHAAACRCAARLGLGLLLPAAVLTMACRCLLFAAVALPSGARPVLTSPALLPACPQPRATSASSRTRRRRSGGARCARAARAPTPASTWRSCVARRQPLPTVTPRPASTARATPALTTATAVRGGAGSNAVQLGVGAGRLLAGYLLCGCWPLSAIDLVPRFCPCRQRAEQRAAAGRRRGGAPALRAHQPPGQGGAVCRL